MAARYFGGLMASTRATSWAGVATRRSLDSTVPAPLIWHGFAGDGSVGDRDVEDHPQEPVGLRDGDPAARASQRRRVPLPNSRRADVADLDVEERREVKPHVPLARLAPPRANGRAVGQHLVGVLTKRPAPEGVVEELSAMAVRLDAGSRQHN